MTRHHVSRPRAAHPLASRVPTPPIERLAQVASEARALLAQLADFSERALAALRRDDTETLFRALEEREPLRDRARSLLHALAAARVALVRDPRRAADSRALAALLAPLEELALRGGTADAHLAQLAATRHEDLARVLAERRA